MNKIELFERFERDITEHYLKHKRYYFLKHYPQMVCFSWDHISLTINTRGRYELENLDNLEELVFPQLNKKRICLDIGANIGNHSLFFSNFFEKVISFEPNPETYEVLSINVRRAKNILAINLGASDSKREIVVHRNPGNFGATKIELDQLTTEGYEEDLVRFNVDILDNTLSPEFLSKVDFIKIDVEGHEIFALRGLKQTLLSANPIVAFELQADQVSNGSSQVVDFLKNCGYTNFYEITRKKRLKKLPKLVRQGVRFIFRGQFLKYKLFKINVFEARLYYMIIASKGTLVTSE
jgi:FkbM family methyltransferase